MGTAFDTITFKASSCDGCGKCMTACAEAKQGAARISIVPGTKESSFELAMCRQCGDPKCVMVCPAGALAKDDGSGVVQWDASRCIDCLLCTAGCSYGGISLDSHTARVSKCDQCDGDPACVKACPTDALQWVTAGSVFNKYGDKEDMFVPGLSGCQGCNSELIMRHAMRKIGRNSVLATPPGCIPGMGSVGYNGLTGTKVPVFHPLLTNTASMLAGVRRHYKRMGRDVMAVALAGDGGTADVGFQSLSGAAERGEEILYICVDNEGYMNTGMQRSGCTPYGAWTSTTPVGERAHGKTQDAKNLPLLMVMHNCAYVATASTAFMQDLYDKLERAIEAAKTGFAYLHIYSPCTTGWRFPSDQNIEVARKAVETNFVLLWEFNPRDGLQLTHPAENAKPIDEYLEVLGKYRHLDPDQVEHIERTLANNLARIRGFAAAKGTARAATGGA